MRRANKGNLKWQTAVKVLTGLLVLAVGVYAYMTNNKKEEGKKIEYGAIKTEKETKTKKLDSLVEDQGNVQYNKSKSSQETETTEEEQTEEQEAPSLTKPETVGDLVVSVTKIRLTQEIERQSTEPHLAPEGKSFLQVYTNLTYAHSLEKIDDLGFVLIVDGKEIPMDKLASEKSNQFPLFNIPAEFTFNYTIAFTEDTTVLTDAKSIELKVFSSDHKSTKTVKVQ